jgi:hypothetical protein
MMLRMSENSAFGGRHVPSVVFLLDRFRNISAIKPPERSLIELARIKLPQQEVTV